LLRAAAADLGLDLHRSWMIGDSRSDVDAGRAAGCRTILLTSAPGDGVTARTLCDAANVVLGDGPESQSVDPGRAIGRVSEPGSTV
jgi:D-glycero-D-manno-heptose 1,7-bisphosphate phosphatase